MSAFALIQINFVSFAAPLATLAIMDKRGVSDRQMAATLAMVFAMGQGNVFTLSPLLDCTGWPRFAFRLSAVCARGGHLARHRAPSVSDRECPGGGATQRRTKQPGVIAVINNAGSDAIRLALGAVPMLILSLTIVGVMQAAGIIDMLQHLLMPLLQWLHIPVNFVLPALVKCIAGGTAYFGVVSELVQQGKVTISQLNASAGLFIQTFDLPGIGIFLGVSSRFVRLFRFAALALSSVFLFGPLCT